MWFYYKPCVMFVKSPKHPTIKNEIKYLKYTFHIRKGSIAIFTYRKLYKNEWLPACADDSSTQFYRTRSVYILLVEAAASSDKGCGAGAVLVGHMALCWSPFEFHKLQNTRPHRFLH